MLAIYIPGRHRNDADALKAVGAEWSLDPAVTPMFVDVPEGGPDGGGGKLVYFDGTGAHSPLAFVDTTLQRWEPAAKCGDQAEGRYWVGIWKDRPPAPEDLQRDEVKDGIGVTLRDGNAWIVPIASYFPRRLAINRSTGEQESRPFAEHRDFLERTNDLFRLLMSDEFQGRVAEELRVMIPDGLAYASQALSQNYRINHDLVDMLEIVGEFEAVQIASVTTGLGLLDGTDIQKKTRSLVRQSCDY